MTTFLLMLAAAATPAISPDLKVVDGRVYVRASVNGVSTEALLDSGSELTVIDPDFAHRAGVRHGSSTLLRGTGGRAHAGVAEGVHLHALGIDLGHRDVVLTELDDVSHRLLKRPTSVILGREVFDSGRVQLDLHRGAIVVMSKASTPVGTRLRTATRGGIEDMPVHLGGCEVMARVDFGNGSEPIVSRGLVRRLGLVAAGERRGGGIGGDKLRQLVHLPPLVIAGKPFHDLVATVDEADEGEHMNVGTSILSRFVVTTDFPNHSIYLAEAKAGPLG